MLAARHEDDDDDIYIRKMYVNKNYSENVFLHINKYVPIIFIFFAHTHTVSSTDKLFRCITTLQCG